MTRYTKEETTEALDMLRKRLSAGDVVYTTQVHMSRSGMTRDIRVTVMVRNEPVNMSWHVARAIGAPMHNGAVRVGGCGMDMGFHIVYSLARVLFRDGFVCTDTDTCPANDHVNARPVEGQSWSEARAATYGPNVTHSDPGYALRHRWL